MLGFFIFSFCIAGLNKAALKTTPDAHTVKTLSVQFKPTSLRHDDITYGSIIVKTELPEVTTPFTRPKYLWKQCPKITREGVYANADPNPNIIP